MKNETLETIIFNAIAVILLTVMAVFVFLGFNSQLSAAFYSFLSAYLALVLYKIRNVAKAMSTGCEEEESEGDSIE